MSPHFLIFYVNSPSESVAFYEKILGSKALEESPTFAMFAIRDGLMLGLWSKHTVKPDATEPGGMEFALTLASNKDVDTRYAQWVEQGITIKQAPIMLDFGYTFVALDPDGHRIRIFAPSA